MSSICLYFEVHQPERLKQYRVFEVGKDHDYFDEGLNREVIERVARKCYLPANQCMLELIRRHEGAFRIAFSLTGVLIDQLKRWAPEVLDSFAELIETGSVELLAETYYHSLASTWNETEFRGQVERHTALMRSTLGHAPRVFRNTELIYDDEIGRVVADLGFEAVLAEGADFVLGTSSPNYVYGHPDRDLALLLKNYRLSDDIAFRFSNRDWDDYPLTPEKFASWIHRISGDGDTVNLFMDYETFGEHHWRETGIFEFLRQLPSAVLSHPDWTFATPSRVIAEHPRVAPLSFGRTVSWADSERDLSAWQGNSMQLRALERVYSLADAVERRGNSVLTDLWRKLQTSDHFYYMSTKWSSDGAVHAYFSPYESPYEAFINYMNVLDDFGGYVVQHDREVGYAS